jgi:hypothetical protein
MGAALTYARRYALFTLVGIAGEDDIDAPDLGLKFEPISNEKGGMEGTLAQSDNAQSTIAPARQAAAPRASLRSRANEGPPEGAGDRQRRPHAQPSQATLGAADSVAGRDQLISELSQLQSLDQAADWAQRNLSIKNTLSDADAELVEASFRERLAAIERDVEAENRIDVEEVEQARPTVEQVSHPSEPQCEEAVSSALLPNGEIVRPRRVPSKAIRLRDKEHCKYVATRPCIVCGRTPSETHHIRFAQPRALSRKVSDEYTVPVCRLHHRELHRYGDEASWWAGVNVDPQPIALELWRQTRAPAFVEDVEHPLASENRQSMRDPKT